MPPTIAFKKKKKSIVQSIRRKCFKQDINRDKIPSSIFVNNNCSCVAFRRTRFSALCGGSAQATIITVVCVAAQVRLLPEHQD